MNQTVKVFDNFFSDSLLKEVLELSEELEDFCFVDSHIVDWEKSKVQFPERLREHHKSNCKMFTFRENEKHLYSDILSKIKKEVREKIEDNLISIQYNYWQPESGIAWHRDEAHHSSATIYLNDDWEPDYGGFFLYTQDTFNIRAVDKVQGIVPKLNRCIWSTTKIPHSVTTTSVKAPVRKTLQLRFRNYNERNLPW